MPNMNTQKQSNFPVPPSFESVQFKNQTVFDLIVEAVKEGTLHVPEYAQSQAESIDYALAPNLVRHKAKLYLIAQGQEAKEEEDSPAFEIEEVSNNGLYAKVPEFRIRILKSSEDGGVPLPGDSETRKNFYNQEQAVFDFAHPVWNLIIHWSVDRQYNLLKLSVALPLKIAKNDLGRAVVECAFDEPFWQSPPLSNVTSITSGPTSPTPSSLNIDGIQIASDEERTGTGEEPVSE